ncbi:MAG: DNA starvation/stationary phase protection protein [Chloroflexi bacterium]|nr:DNA starvation/stationary phase protection protein [Chloroflexota bacterium]
MAVKTQQALKQRLGDFVESPIVLGQDVCRQVCDLLNSDVCSEFVLYHQTKKHHWIVSGPQFYEIHKLLDSQAHDIRKVADEIAERITYLGGVPVSGMAKMESMAYVKPEEEGIFDLRSSLQRDLEMNQAIIVRYRQQIERCEQLKDYGTGYCLMKWLAQQEKWAHELDNLLETDGLVSSNGHR